MIFRYLTRYLPSYPKVLLYMLQDTEYHLPRYLSWYNRTTDFRAQTVMKRRQLDTTNKVKLLLVALMLAEIVIWVATILSILQFATTLNYAWLAVAIGLAVLEPLVLAYGVVVPLFIGWVLIQKPQERLIISRAKKVLSSHPGRRIGIAGSFGKTTAKEILLAVLSEGAKVAATPGNMNTAIGISRFAMTLRGDEEVLIFELGEEKVGDVRRLSRLTKPEFGIITGANEAHLSSFKTLDRTVGTIFELADFVDPSKLYKNDESDLVKSHKDAAIRFDRKGLKGWKVTNTSTSVLGTEFDISNGDVTIHAQTALVGMHTIGVTVAGIVVSHELGLNKAQIEAGLRKVQPFEHRMQPRPMHGAWIIDDTYNGNSQGVEAGLAFLKTVDAKRRIYVTPGLVEQGSRTQKVHEKIGEQIAGSADVVVLMNNSVTEFIKTGLKRKRFHGKLIEVDDPLEFYQNLDQFVAAGDVVLMQNDWTDNYQ